LGKNVIALALISMVFLFGCTQQPAPTNGDAIDDSLGDSLDGSMADDGATDDHVGDSMDDGSMDDSMDDDGAMEEGATFYKPFTKAEYDAAKAGGKVIYLEFYANWCPFCRTQKPILESAFMNPEMPGNVAGFQVNYNDSDTDQDETNLARQFGITYQHTRIVLDSSGTQAHRSIGQKSELELISIVKIAVGA